MDEYEKWLKKQVAIYSPSDEDYMVGKFDAYENSLDEYRSFKAKAYGGVVEKLKVWRERWAKPADPKWVEYRNEFDEILRAHEGGEK